MDRFPDEENLILHATTVALNGAAVAITGRSGSGKSSLGLALMALGCDLVADDRTIIRRVGDTVEADCPEAIRGLIEARGVGILNARSTGPARLAFVIDLDQDPPERLPQQQEIALLGVTLPLIASTGTEGFAAAVAQLLKCGRNR